MYGIEVTRSGAVLIHYDYRSAYPTELVVPQVETEPKMTEGQFTVDIATLVERAVALQIDIKGKQAELENMKATLRECAKKDSPSGEKVTYRAATGTGIAEIVFVAPHLKIKRGAEPRLLLGSVLDEPTYEHLFREETKTVLCKDFDEALKLLKKSQQDAIKKLIEVETPDPRVSLK